MTWLIDFTVRLIQAGQRVYAKKWRFLAIFVIAFLGSILTLAKFDLLPETSSAPTVTLVASTLVATDASALASRTEAEFPTSMTIPAIKLEVNIANPDTTDISALDNLLLKGAVRYPTSAKLGEAGNVILFGHSSYLPVVGNQAYKTFNGIQKLVAGDVITLYSLNRAYTYQVRNVSKESANDGAIPLSVVGRVLTLSTCDSFGAKTDRFVIVADFVESHSVSS